MPLPPAFPAVLPVSVTVRPVRVWAIKIGDAVTKVAQPGQAGAITVTEKSSVQASVT